MFDATRLNVADAVSTLITDGLHPALIYAAMMSEISTAIATAGFWGTEEPVAFESRGYWNLSWRLQEKAFAEQNNIRKDYIMDEYSITYRSVGAGLQTWECRALNEHDAADKFSEFCERYSGNRFAKGSITSVDRVEDVGDD